ncbi:MAG: hypothetical protein RJA63_4142 [Pseudomonadota bacterium]|jgi:hypothetical protein
MKNTERFELDTFTGSINMDLVTHIIDDSPEDKVNYHLRVFVSGRESGIPLSVTRKNVRVTQFYQQYVAMPPSAEVI